jgi:predicted ATPase
VPRLPTPEDPTSLPAERLFVERVQAVSSQFALDTTNAQTIEAICHRVDRTPLAIELVAARINILTPHTLLARRARRLPLLASGAADLPDCHRALRNMFAWSAELLGSAERRLLPAGGGVRQ